MTAEEKKILRSAESETFKRCFQGFSTRLQLFQSHLILRVKVHLDPYLISVIENNPNKNIIVLMSIKQKFRQSKRRKGKKNPTFMLIQMKGLGRSFKGVSMKFCFIFLEYRNTVLLRGVCE
jgi:hypothetical protein